MMPGMIMLWYGSIASIPTGWTLCDGTNGSPNLKDYFVRGAGTGPSWAPGGTGGASTHTHEFTGDGHAHDLASGDQIQEVTPAGHHYHGTSTNPASGTTDSSDHKPKYMNLCYIMKTPIP